MQLEGKIIIVISQGLLICSDSVSSLEDSCLSVSSILCREIQGEVRGVLPFFFGYFIRP